MNNPLTTAFSGLPALDQLRAQAATIDVAATRLPANAHIHLPPNFSAFDTISKATDLAADQSVGVLGVSNYYDYSVYGPFTENALAHNIFPLYGLEIIAMIDGLRNSGVLTNDPGNPGKIYICGKGITTFSDMSPRGAEILQKIRDNDRDRMTTMTSKLDTVCRERGFDAAIDGAAVIDMIVDRHNSPRGTVYIQERHIAQAFQEALFTRVGEYQRAPVLAELLGQDTKDADDDVGVQGEIRSHLMKAGKPAFVDESFVALEEAVELILQFGGIPSYPTLADGTSPICTFEDPVDELLQNLRNYNFHAAEFIPIRNTADVLTTYATAMRDAGMVVTGGTEHNTLDLIGIEPTCVGKEPVPDSVKEIFWEGACVVAAHQYLGHRGESGFVDHAGEPNSDYSSANERIEAFSRLGAAIINAYRNPGS
jgi:predicted metal-dependent phosphoesterase TrpH